MGFSPFSPAAALTAFQGRGVVERRITPANPGRVSFQASYWPARLVQSSVLQLNPGDLVEIVGREGLTLLVKPLP